MTTGGINIYGCIYESGSLKAVEKWIVYQCDTFYIAAKKLHDMGTIGDDILVLRSGNYCARRDNSKDLWRLYCNNEYVTILDNIIY